MLLKTGILAMAVALAFAIVVGLLALRHQPQKVEAAQAEEVSADAPLHRTYPQGASEEKEAEPETGPEPEARQREADPEAQPRRDQRGSSRGAVPNWPAPTERELEAAGGPRDFGTSLPDGAIMGLTIGALGLKNVPVYSYDGEWALDNGVAHEPETSLPWSDTRQRNVYIVGHRYGWPGTDSHLVFLHLDRLARGDRIVLEGRDGGTYAYRVTEAFEVDPGDSWVMGQVRGRDMLTLQTCTPIPSWERRLIVRADRV